MRVIAGALGGRRLVAPRGLLTRPTSDRVREALFSILGDVRGARVLDLYAGTGALGLEALSRGAERAVFVESGRAALAALRENVRALAPAGAEIVSTTVERAIGPPPTVSGPFDLLFADPPYAASATALARIASAAASGTLLAPDVRVVVEHASRDSLETPVGWTLTVTRAYGDTALSIYHLGRVPHEA